MHQIHNNWIIKTNCINRQIEIIRYFYAGFLQIILKERKMSTKTIDNLILINMEEHTKLYSLKAISIATFFGGPLAAGILIRRNFVNMEKDRLGLNALFIGILTTVLLFVVIFQMPESIINAIPNFLIPAIYTFIIYLIVRHMQGEQLKQHKEEGLPFYTAWRATGVGLICTVLIMGAIIAYEQYELSKWDYKTFDREINKFTENEAEALRLFDMIDINTKAEVTTFIENTGIPKWEENLLIIERLDALENLPVEIIEKTQLLREYCRLRIESYQMISKAVSQKTLLYQNAIIEKHMQIEKVLDELNN